MYRMQYPRKKKPRKISDAVFRGKKSAYSFQVFPLTAEIADTPAVFIISRRRTDKLGHGHQSAVCIGETNSISSELKKHKRAKCVKNNEPNVVCLLEEPSSTARAGVLADISAAHKFGCIQNVYDSTIKPKSYEPPKPTRRAKRIVPEISAKPEPVPAKRDAAKPKKAAARPASGTGGKAKPVAPKSAARSERKNAVRKTASSKPRTVAPKPAAKPLRAKRKPTAAPVPAKRKSTTAPAPTRRKPAAAVKKTVAKTPAVKKAVAKTAPAKRAKPSRTAAAVPAAKRVAAKRIAKTPATAKPVKKQPVPKRKHVVKKAADVKAKIATTKRPKPVPAKNAKAAKARQPIKSAAKKRPTATAGTRSRVSGSVDSDRRQHRLSKQEKPVNKRAKSRADGKSRPRKKAAA